MTTSNGFLQNRQVRSLIRFNECYAFVMLMIFSFMPYLALFAPPEFGPLFSGIARLEIYAFLFLGVFQLISYASFTSNRHSLKDRMTSAFIKFYNSVKNDKTGILFIAVYILCIISAVAAFTSGDGFDGVEFTQTRMFKGTDFRPDGLRMYTCFLVIYVFASMIKKREFKKALLIINIVGFLAVSLVMLQQYYGIIGSTGVKDAGKFGRSLSRIYEDFGVRYGHFYKGNTGCFYNQNHVAYYATVGAMLISGMFLFAEKPFKKIIWGILAVYSYYIITINNTFGCYLATIIALILTAGIIIAKDKERNIKKIINAVTPAVLFLLVTLSFSVFSPDANPVKSNFNVFTKDVTNIASSEDVSDETEAGSGRMGMWLATVDMIGEKPLFGWGADNLKAEYVEREEDLDRAHNEPLEIAVANGIPASVLYYVAIAIALILFIRNKAWFSEPTRLIPFMAALGYLISSMVGVFLFYTAGYFFMMFALACSRE